MILAGDIGGTKTYLGRFILQNGKPVPIEIRSFRTLDYSSLESMVGDFLTCDDHVEVAAFGIPGPVVDHRVDVTNVPWSLDATKLSRTLNLRRVHLVNDLVATGYGTQTLSAENLFTLNVGEPVENQTEALIAAGTGLGECILYSSGTKRWVLPCEAGHAAFAPHDSLQVELAQYLMQRSPYLCVERVLSGPGLVSIYEFLRDTQRVTESSAIAEVMREQDPAAIIAAAAESETDELCCRAMEMFVTAYGSECGNLAVRSMALGGIYIGGGIAPKILRQLADGRFIRAFAEKERMEDMLRKIPVRVILDDRTGLAGAALFASQNLSADDL